MRKSNRNLLLASFAIGALAIGGAACQSGGGDVNAHDITVTVKIPKALVTSASGIGVVYVGVYSGIDNTKGYPSPVTAPAASSAGDNTFPFGGTSMGDFATRDARYVCQAVYDQTVVDAGDHWEVKASVLQFPWVKGQIVWAFSDRYSKTLFNNSTPPTAFKTCDPRNGYTDNYGIPIDISSVTSFTNVPTAPYGVNVAGPYWLVSFAPNPAGSISSYIPTNKQTEILDAGGQFYQTVELTSAGHLTGTFLLNNTADTIVVSTPVGTSLSPKATGATPARLELNDGSSESYGTQFQDILNFPSKYIESGDLLTSQTGTATLNSPSDVTITLDTTVP